MASFYVLTDLAVPVGLDALATTELYSCPMKIQNILTIDNISIIRDEKYVVKNFGLTLLPSCILKIIGDNGSGKSSLLRSIAGLLPINTGKILHNVNSNCLLIDHHLGFDINIMVRHILQHWCNTFKTPMLFDAAIHFLDLEEYLTTPAYKLSMGWRKRLSLARLIIKSSDVWLLDEPYNYLDKAGSQKLDDLVNGKSNAGGIVIKTDNNTNKSSVKPHAIIAI